MTYIVPNTPINNTLPPVNFHTVITHQTVTRKPSLIDSFKPKRAGTKTSHVIFILDDSASMISCRQSTISGFNEFLQLQAEDAKISNIPTFVSLYKFNGGLTQVINRVSVSEIEPLSEKNYYPNGMTNLYDAIGGVMMNINKILSSSKKSERDSIIVVILTDGEENASRTFDNNTIKEMIKKSELKNWSFMFLGANIDAFSVGSSLGFGSLNTMQYDSNDKTMNNTMRAASGMTSRLKHSFAAGTSVADSYVSATFTDAERTESVIKHD